MLKICYNFGTKAGNVQFIHILAYFRYLILPASMLLHTCVFKYKTLSCQYSSYIIVDSCVFDIKCAKNTDHFHPKDGKWAYFSINMQNNIILMYLR